MCDLKQLMVGEAFVHLEQVEVGGDGPREQSVVAARLGLGVDRPRQQPARARTAGQLRRARARTGRAPLALVR